MMTHISLFRRPAGKWQCRLKKSTGGRWQFVPGKWSRWGVSEDGRTMSGTFSAIRTLQTALSLIGEIKNGGGELVVHYGVKGRDGTELTNAAHFEDQKDLLNYIRIFTEANLLKNIPVK